MRRDIPTVELQHDTLGRTRVTPSAVKALVKKGWAVVGDGEAVTLAEISPVTVNAPSPAATPIPDFAAGGVIDAPAVVLVGDGTPETVLERPSRQSTRPAPAGETPNGATPTSTPEEG